MESSNLAGIASTTVKQEPVEPHNQLDERGCPVNANQPVSHSPPGQSNIKTGRTSVGRDGHDFGSSTEEQNSQDSCAGFQLHAPTLNPRRTPPDCIPCEPPGASSTMIQESQVALQDLDGPSTQETEVSMVSNICERTPDQKPWIIGNKGGRILIPQREKHSGGIESISNKSRVSISHPEDLLSRDGKETSALERRYFYGSQGSDTNHLTTDGLGASVLEGQLHSQRVPDANPRSPGIDMMQASDIECLDDRPSAKGLTMIHESGVAVRCQEDLVSQEDTGTYVLEGTSCQRSQNHCAAATASLNEEEQLSQCKICLKSFMHLKSHMKVHTSERPFKCSVCDKGFIERRHLENHMRSHTGEKPFECSVCQKAFSRATHLTYHLRTHTGIRPFSCETCGRSFGRKGDMTVHMRIHTGERPFACKLCDKTCSTQSNLTLHMRGHTGERPYSCTACPKTFKSKSDLIKHVRMHTGEKPYQCGVCHKEFRASSDLTRHMRAHTNEKPYKCDVCLKEFSSDCYLPKHVCAPKTTNMTDMTDTD
ncbi:zinc finger protein 696 isoform X2 [Strongylocentrotus purpuratus]|uniref:C2H2-type domain-containing protein n=1 Tax=Strongylocentrotus purpuratus TaxID=7668 RepID=A0A7M7T2B1_STRPU|nr:zinc finger protein 696 isoform X2 [Strongylocentrotus purpuratus]